MTFRFCNDETLETRALVILPVGIAGVNGVLREYVVPGGAPLLLSKEFLRDLGRGHLFFEKLGSASSGDNQTVTASAFALEEFWTTRSRLKTSHASVLTNVQSTVPHVTA